MTHVQAAIETIASLDQLVDALDGLVSDQFQRSVRIEITNGVYFDDGSEKAPGIPYVICAHDQVRKYDNNDWISVQEASGRYIDLTPPGSLKMVPPGDGFIVGADTNYGYGVNLMVPVVTCPLWLDAPAGFSTAGSKVPQPPVPQAVTAAGFTNPVAFYVWLVFGGLYKPPGGSNATSPISYSISPVNYSPSAGPVPVTKGVLDTVWDDVLYNRSSSSGEEEEIGPDSPLQKTLDTYSPDSAASLKFKGVVAGKQQKECFLTEDGKPCRLWVHVVTGLDKNKKESEVRVEISNSVK